MGTPNDAGFALAVVDDDPTGTQTVRDVPLVTGWDDASLDWAIGAADPTFAVLTNSRSLPERRAVELNRQIGAGLAAAARRMDVPLRVISRSDSTLRGHFPAEVEALAAGLEGEGQPTDCVLICPAFPEAGRVTDGDVHFVRIGETLVPAGETEFARDSAFGYRSSNLCDWVRERAGAAATVASISLEDARGGPEVVARRLGQARGRARYLVANARETEDLDAIAAGVELAERGGLRVICRSGPSFVSSRAGRSTAEPLSDPELGAAGARGLLVVGSHTALTTAQLERARASHDFATVTLDVSMLLGGDKPARRATIESAEHALRAALSKGDAALVTSRRRVHDGDGVTSLASARIVADAVVDVVGGVAGDPGLGWILAKGGITSNDVAVRSLGMRRGTVLGQLFRGQISIWELGPESRRPGMRVVVFPGNVGDESALARALDRLRGQR